MNKTLIINASQIVTPIGNRLKKGSEMADLKIIENGAILIEDGIIKAVGSNDEVASNINIGDYQLIDASGNAILPGFIDSHTHFVFGGYRADEFDMRLKGAQYLDILKQGGGILKTVEDTKNATPEELYQLAIERINSMLEQGITTVEGKSGYGLDYETELKQLEVMKRLDQNTNIDVVATYLGAHAIPKGSTSSEYIDYIIKEVLPTVAKEKLAEFCDVFCEEGVFSIEESRKLLLAAKELGLKVKIHADEIVRLGGGELAAELQAVSADHLLNVSEQGIKDLIHKGVVTTLLPCTAFSLGKPFANGRMMIDNGCAVALASDFNPGSSFTNSVPLMIALAVINMKMTIEEAITALTLNGAAALDRADTIGSIEVGKKADLVILKYPSYKFLVYNTGVNIVKAVIKSGEVCE